MHFCDLWNVVLLNRARVHLPSLLNFGLKFMFEQTLRLAFLKKQKNLGNKKPWWFPTGLRVALGDKYNAGLHWEGVDAVHGHQHLHFLK